MFGCSGGDCGLGSFLTSRRRIRAQVFRFAFVFYLFIYFNFWSLQVRSLIPVFHFSGITCSFGDKNILCPKKGIFFRHSPSRLQPPLIPPTRPRFGRGQRGQEVQIGLD